MPMVIIFSLGMKKPALGGFLSGADESFQVQRLTLDGSRLSEKWEIAFHLPTRLHRN